MPVTPTGAGLYNSSFQAKGIRAGFDVNQSGYGETVSANQNIRPVPWANPGFYVVIAQVAGLQPITRSYQITLYDELDYGALRALVGESGTLTTPREGSPSPGQPQPAMLTSLRRGSYQYPAWPFSSVSHGIFPADDRDLQTAVIEFTMLSPGGG